MGTKLRVLLAGRSRAAITDIESLLSGRQRLDVEFRHIVNGHTDPLYGLPEVPDLLVLHIGGLEGGELEALLERPASTRPPMVVVSQSGDPAIMRLAMKAGARDFLSQSEVAQVMDSVDAVCEELTGGSGKAGEMLAVVNAKGGSGATFLACNLAHLAVSTTGRPAALVGLDMQFPTLPAYFDMRLRFGLAQAIGSVDELDAVALDAIMATHKSGLKILAACPEDFRFTFDAMADSALRLFDLLQSQYAHVVVDVPRRLDELNAQVLSRSTRIALVVQQSLPHVQDATRMQQLLRDQLGVPADRVVAVVNRFEKNNDIQLADIEKALPGSAVVTVPNQFKVVSESVNLGIPMYEHARQSGVTRAIIELQSRLIGTASGDHPALAAGRLSSLLQKSPLHQLFGGN